MMFDVPARVGVLAVLAALLYYWLLPYVIGYAFVILPGYEALLSMIDSRLIATHIWLQLAHTLAVLIAAMPVAALIHFSYRSHAIVVAAVVGVLIAVASLVSTFLTESVRGVRTDGYIVALVFDHAKIALVVPALVWLGRLLPSNNALEQTRDGKSASIHNTPARCSTRALDLVHSNETRSRNLSYVGGAGCPSASVCVGTSAGGRLLGLSISIASRFGCIDGCRWIHWWAVVPTHRSLYCTQPGGSVYVYLGSDRDPS
jgi:hypothetical protein